MDEIVQIIICAACAVIPAVSIIPMFKGIGSIMGKIAGTASGLMLNNAMTKAAATKRKEIGGMARQGIGNNFRSNANKLNENGKNKFTRRIGKFGMWATGLSGGYSARKSHIETEAKENQELAEADYIVKNHDKYGAKSPFTDAQYQNAKRIQQRYGEAGRARAAASEESKFHQEQVQGEFDDTMLDENKKWLSEREMEETSGGENQIKWEASLKHYQEIGDTNAVMAALANVHYEDNKAKQAKKDAAQAIKEKAPHIASRYAMKQIDENGAITAAEAIGGSNTGFVKKLADGDVTFDKLVKVNMEYAKDIGNGLAANYSAEKIEAMAKTFSNDQIGQIGEARFNAIFGKDAAQNVIGSRPLIVQQKEPPLT
jgi:hypothetical protein